MTEAGISGVTCKMCDEKVPYDLQSMIEHLYKHESLIWSLVMINFKFE